MDNQTAPLFMGGELLAGKYRIERVIGEGGMGLVLAAKHEQLNQNVAIKLLREEALKFNQVVGRFMREARAAVSLRSEHVARVLDVGSLDDGRPYIVMERLEGQDLGEVIESRQNIPIAEAVDWVIQACEAIAEAHAAGIVHRDLKPKNLFLTRAVHGKPLVKVLDFGISKIDPQHAPGDMQLTKTTEVIGSPSYMSPEQLRSSRDVDGRADVWALGVILYELLTSRVPFYAETVTELVVVVVTEKEPPVRSVRPDVPEGLAAIIARCLEKRPEHRFQNVLELVQALEPYAHGAHGHNTSASDRIAAVAGIGTRLLSPSAAPPTMPSSGGAVSGPPQPSSGALPPTPSSRVNVHGGTSVAWGATQSQPVPPILASGPPPAPPQRSKAGLYAGLAVGALACVGIAIGGTAYAVRRTTTHPTQVMSPAAGESAMPLPPGRKDLPPVPPPPEPPASAPVADPTTSASSLPVTRKPPPPAAGPAAKPAPKPPSAGKDAPPDLDNIGRR